MPDPILTASGINKSYGAVHAVVDAEFAAAAGEVHALVGENGAGKSTLIKIMCGATSPDTGSVTVNGQPVSSPDEARIAGVRTVFQELTLMPWLTVAENLLLGREPRGVAGLIKRRTLNSTARSVLDELGVEEIDPGELASNLPLAQQQVVEIARAIHEKPKVLFLDEPTSSLAAKAVDWLFTQVRALAEAGTCVIFTSHRWSEIGQISDRITVFRNGHQVGTYASDLDESEAIRLMTGRSIGALYPAVNEPTDKTLLQVSGLSGGRLTGVDLSVRAGEILGIGGLAGQGQRDLFMRLFGAARYTGTISIDGRAVRLTSPRQAVKAGVGIALVPEDRKNEGLLLPMSVGDNLTLPILDRVSVAGVLDTGKERTGISDMISQLAIKTSSPRSAVSNLSGGNQQKVLLGKWLLAECRVMLMYDITRGVDVATKRDIYALMVDLARDGHALVFYSSETDELAHLCHRVLVMREGRIARELEGPGIESEHIVDAAMRERVAP